MNNSQAKTFYPVALTIAGSDSGGGAGIQADLRTFAAYGVFGCSAIAAVTAQNPFEVGRVDTMPPESVVAQIDAVTAEFAVSAVKTGMLANAAIVEAAAAAVAELENIPLVVDPVMVSTSGHRLLDQDAIDIVKTKLLPLADWMTPNIPEAEILTGMKITGRRDMVAAALECSDRWNCGCIVKGGHASGETGRAEDIVAIDGEVLRLSTPLVEDTRATHGTGCAFSAALAAGLALDFGWHEALKAAKAFVFGSLTEAVLPGWRVEAMYPPSGNYIEKVKFGRMKR